MPPRGRDNAPHDEAERQITRPRQVGQAGWAVKKDWDVGPGLARLGGGLDLQADLHLLAYQDTAGLKGLVPVQAEVTPVQDGAGGEAGPLATPGIGAGADELGFERDLAGDAVKGQVADDHKSAATLW